MSKYIIDIGIDSRKIGMGALVLVIRQLKR